MEKKYTKLLPVNQDRGTEINPALGPITFYHWRNAMLQKIISGSYSSWPNNNYQDTENYLVYTVTGFCSNIEKIMATQAIIKACMKEKELCSFILRDSRKYDEWCRGGADRLNVFEMVQQFEGFLNQLRSTFQSVSKDSKITLAPFIDHVENIHNSVEMKEIREFMSYFVMPMEFRTTIKPPWNYEKDNMLKTYRDYPGGSTERQGIMRADFELDALSCTVLNDDKTISLDALPVIAALKNSQNKKIHYISRELITNLFGVTIFELYRDLVKTEKNPLQMIISIAEVSKGYELSMTIEESCPADQMKDVRNALQKNIIGKKVKMIVEEKKYAIYNFLFRTKTAYFSSFFESHVQGIIGNFGHYLLELRYIAFLAEHLVSLEKKVPFVFPTVLPIKDDETHIISAYNPSLLYEAQLDASKVVSNDIHIDDNLRVQLLTGPNKNGKSRFMDSIGLNQILFQAGWPVFGTEARMSPKTDLRVHYVGSGIGISGESRFSHECKRMFEVFSKSTGSHSLYLIDEPYTGTNPLDAEVLLKEMLSACSDQNATVFLTTHFHGLISLIDELPNGNNLHCVISETGGFTFHIENGSSVLSNALEVASTAGVRYDSIKAILEQKKQPPVIVTTIEPVATNALTKDYEEDDLPF